MKFIAFLGVGAVAVSSYLWNVDTASTLRYDFQSTIPAGASVTVSDASGEPSTSTLSEDQTVSQSVDIGAGLGACALFLAGGLTGLFLRGGKSSETTT